MDSGFHKWLDSRFSILDSLAGFRIPQTKIIWIPDSGLPYMKRKPASTRQDLFVLVAIKALVLIDMVLKN